MQQLGGSAIYLNTRDSQLGRGEPVEDAAQVISRMSDIVMIRTFEQDDHRALCRQFARAGDQRPDQRIPPVPDPGRHLHLHRASRPASRARPWPGSAIPTTCATPGCRRPKCSISTSMSRRRPATKSKPERAGLYGTGHFESFADPMDAARGADLVTTDVWTSMGFEAENEERLKRDFADWQVDGEMMRVARTRMRCSCTACPRIAARKWPPRSSTARNAWCGTRPRTACTCRRR